MADVKVWNGKCEWGGVRGEVCMGRCEQRKSRLLFLDYLLLQDYFQVLDLQCRALPNILCYHSYHIILVPCLLLQKDLEVLYLQQSG